MALMDQRGSSCASGGELTISHFAGDGSCSCGGGSISGNSPSLARVVFPLPKSGLPDPGPLAIMALNEYCQKSRQTLSWAEKTLALAPPRFEIGARVGGQQMPTCEGQKKREAKGLAALAALKKLVQSN